MTATVALIGNPNSGKTTLFNCLTGTHQKVGNWPGVTVERKSGEFRIGDATATLVDLPGVYSLEQEFQGIDEKIARDFLAHEHIDVVVNIVDASNVERNLVLTQQLLELGTPVVVALNMLDVAERNGVHIDAGALAAKLGVPVVNLVASRQEGVDALVDAIALVAATPTGRARAAPTDDEPAERMVRRYHESRRLADGVVEVRPVLHTLSDQIDHWALNRWLGIPIFLAMMYLMFTVAINLGAVFIDFFDILAGAVFVDTTRWALESIGAPAWISVLLADGLGGGIALVSTFIPVIGFLFLCLSVLEDSGYLSRAGFVIDRLMSRLGLPGSAFVPLIVGFGCNVPSVMATRSLGRDSDRLLTITMAPFMSCGARLTVYALFAAAFFPSGGQNVVFALYLLGIVLAVATGYIFRRQIFDHEITPSMQEMPAYHVPVVRNILLTTWFRLRGFVFRAGKTIVLVVIGLSFLNSIGTDGSFGHQDSEQSILSSIGRQITPAFAPMGVAEDNWPATVGLFTGMFAKEAVVGTLDALYNTAAPASADGGPPDLVAAAGAAMASVGAALIDLGGALTDPLGLDIGDTSDQQTAAAEQGIATTTLSEMARLFVTPFAAFCYLVFILLYAPCVAVLGAVVKEAGWRWMVLVFSWTTGLAYITATALYQVGTFTEHPGFSAAWLAGCGAVLWAAILSLKRIGRGAVRVDLIEVVQV